MSILESIKGERKLSFNHWRFRLLHWCFGVEAPQKGLYHTELPRFLYTHFCPLFHITNLIAILSPLILLIKIIKVVVLAIAHATASIPLTRLLENLRKRMPESSTPDAPPKPSEQEKPTMTKQKARRAIITSLVEWTSPQDRFEHFWNSKGCDYASVIDKKEVESLYLEYTVKFAEAKKRSEARKKKIRENMIFWSNFSRIFIKWALNIFYGALVLGVLYVLYIIASPVWDVLCWIGGGFHYLFTNEGSLDTLLIVGKVAIWAAVFIASMTLLIRIGWLQKFGDALYTGMCKVSPPFYLFGKFLDWIASGFGNVIDFCKMFYEENCPPIILIDEEEAVVEAVAERNV
jgi:hypothetical protein